MEFVIVLVWIPLTVALVYLGDRAERHIKKHLHIIDRANKGVIK